MGIFGGLGGFFGNPDNLQLIGAGLKDIASPEESNLAKVTEMVRKRRASDDLMKAIQAQIGGGEAASIPTSVPQPGFNGIGPGEDGNPLAGPKLNGQRLPQPRMSVRSLLGPLLQASSQDVDVGQTVGLLDRAQPKVGMAGDLPYTQDDDGTVHYGQRAPKPPQVVNLGGGGVAVFDGSSLRVIREPTQKAPAGFKYDENGDLTVDQGFVDGRGKIANVLAAATAAHRAPRVGRSGGGSSGGSGLPPGYVPR